MTSEAHTAESAMDPTTAPSKDISVAEVCDVCGNSYDKPLDVTYRGRSYTFDCLECAVHQLAPQCANCHCRVIGHGVEVNGAFYCCAHCARAHGRDEPRDRVDE